jgi:ABC-type Fe3+-hydroxamate transport system substrate-binding protein
MAGRALADDQGSRVLLPAAVRRVVSLVPSLTEAVAASAPGALVGATDWCAHPVGLDVERVRGTKNPDVDRIIGLAPDVVLANFEENREPDIAALREAGVQVWVTVIRTLPEAISSLGRMLAACGFGRPPWLVAAERAWRVARPLSPNRSAAVVVWRRPWMVVGRDTFAGDLLDRLGVGNVFADAAERYPRASPDDMRAAGADLIVLPDEPYRFTVTDGPECFPGLDVALVSGRHLTWYGPSLAEAPKLLVSQLSAPLGG